MFIPASFSSLVPSLPTKSVSQKSSPYPPSAAKFLPNAVFFLQDKFPSEASFIFALTASSKLFATLSPAVNFFGFITSLAGKAKSSVPNSLLVCDSWGVSCVATLPFGFEPILEK